MHAQIHIKSIQMVSFKKIIVSVLFLGSLFSTDLMVFGKLDSDLAEAGVPPELLPMNRHPREKLIRNLRFVFGTGLSFNGFYPYSVGIGKISYPQNASGALTEMFFPNPFVFSPNARPGTISGLTSLDLGQLVGRVAKSSNRDEVVAAFSNALKVDEMPDASIVDFSKDNFYEVIRSLYQDHFDKYARDISEEDQDDRLLKNLPKGREVTTIIERSVNLTKEANSLLALGFFDAQPNVEDRELLKKRRNQYLLFLVGEALKEHDGRNTLLGIISTFAWQKFKSVKDVEEFYSSMTGKADLDFSVIPPSETLKVVAELSALESPDEITKQVVALPESVRKGHIRSTESWAAPPFATLRQRSVTYLNPSSKSKNPLTFSDCVEAQVRAFFNGLLHTITEAGIVFDISKLPGNAPIREFYKGDFLKYESASSQKTHDEFAASVVRIPHIKYASPKTQKEISNRTAEIWSGVGNLAKVLCYLSGLDDPEMAEKAKTEVGIKELFTALGGYLTRKDFALSFNLDIHRNAAIDDFFGEIEGIVNGTKSFTLLAHTQHGELNALQKPKPTWLSKLPSSGDAFESLPLDLKHCVYTTMPMEEFAALDLALQRSAIMSSSLTDAADENLADLTKWAIHCFSSTNHALRSLALPIAQRLLHVGDYNTTRYFVGKFFPIIKASPDCLTKEEYIALSGYDSFLSCDLDISADDGIYVRPIRSIMILFGYMRGWLAEEDVVSNVKSLNLNSTMAYTVWGDTPITTDDLVSIVGKCRSVKRLSLEYGDDLIKYAKVVSNLSVLEYLSLSANEMKNPKDAFIDEISHIPSLLALNISGASMWLCKGATINFAGKCFKKFENLKLLTGLCLGKEDALRETLLSLKKMGLSSKVKLGIPFEEDEDYTTYQARISGIYQKVVEHDIPEDFF